MSSGTSYNGWPGDSDKSAIDVVPFGDKYGMPFPGGVKAGDVQTVLGYVCVQLHYRVEPCISGWDWGYSWKQNVNNPSQLSCHASGTAIDWCAPLHPNGVSGTFTDAQVGEIYAILDEVSGAVDWLEGYDEMHFEIAVDAETLAEIAAGLPAIGPAPTPEVGEDMASTVALNLNGSPHVWVVGSDKRIYERWPDSAFEGGWTPWTPGVPGEWSGGLSALGDSLPQIWGVAADGVTVQTVFSDGSQWVGPVPWFGIDAL